MLLKIYDHLHQLHRAPLIVYRGEVYLRDNDDKDRCRQIIQMVQLLLLSNNMESYFEHDLTRISNLNDLGEILVGIGHLVRGHLAAVVNVLELRRLFMKVSNWFCTFCLFVEQVDRTVQDREESNFKSYSIALMNYFHCAVDLPQSVIFEIGTFLNVDKKTIFSLPRDNLQDLFHIFAETDLRRRDTYRKSDYFITVQDRLRDTGIKLVALNQFE